MEGMEAFCSPSYAFCKADECDLVVIQIRFPFRFLSDVLASRGCEKKVSIYALHNGEIIILPMMK